MGLFTILARGMRLKIFSTLSRTNNVIRGALNFSPRLVEQTFKCTHRNNSVISNTRSTSKACIVQKLSIAHLAPISWPAALAPFHRIGCFYRFSLADIDIVTCDIWLSSLLVIACTASSIQQVSAATSIALTRLSTSCVCSYSPKRSPE